jgi:VanZ family protein
MAVNKAGGVRYWLPVGLWMGVIFCSSSATGPSLPSLFPNQAVIFHLVVYTVLGWLFSRALQYQKPGIIFTKIVCYTVIFGLLYGFSDEIHQLFVPGRHADFFDLMLDGSGSFVGGYIQKWLM